MLSTSNHLCNVRALRLRLRYLLSPLVLPVWPVYLEFRSVHKKFSHILAIERLKQALQVSLGITVTTLVVHHGRESSILVDPPEPVRQLVPVDEPQASSDIENVHFVHGQDSELRKSSVKIGDQNLTQFKLRFFAQMHSEKHVVREEWVSHRVHIRDSLEHLLIARWLATSPRPALKSSLSTTSCLSIVFFLDLGKSPG